MRRFIACIVAFILSLGLLPASAVADEEPSGDDGGSAVHALNDALLADADVPTDSASRSPYAADATSRMRLSPQADSAENYSFDSTGVQSGLKGVQVSAESLGIGGGGALFAPAISPHDANTFVTGCDMGGVYVTHDAGGHWVRHELAGQTMYAVTFDPARAGYVYAGSSALARSHDNGDTWELLWPKAESILGDPNKYEELRHYYYNAGNWDATCSIKAIAVDPNEPTHLYVLANRFLQEYNWESGWELFQSLDDGASFTSLGITRYEKRGIDANYEDPRLLVLDGTPYAFVQTGIFRPGTGSTLECVYDPASNGSHSVVSADLMTDGRIAVAEALDAPPASGTYRPRTSLRLFALQADGTLAADEDFTEELGASKDGQGDPTRDFSLMCDRYGGSDFSVAITRLRASGKRLYFISVSQQPGKSSFISLLGLCDLEKAAGSRMRWVYGFPQWNDFWKNDSRHFDEYDIVDSGHSDTFYQQFGLATDPRNPKAFLLDTGGGCLYSDDCDFWRSSEGKWPSCRSNIRQLYTASPAEGEFATTGIDEQTTYGLRQDPFDASHLALLYTDVGLWASSNGGTSWSKQDAGSTLSSNVYDLVFDRHVEGLAYAAWSAQHDAPYQKSFAQTNARGGVALSTDGGATWTKIGTGLPDSLVAVRLAMVYPTSEAQRQAGTNRTMWLATFGQGFWRSEDGGRTFVKANDGIATTSDNLVLGADIVASTDGSHVFALTARGSSAQGKTQGGSHGRVYEWNASEGKWEALAWPEGADVEWPKALCWDEASSTLYVSCLAAYDKVSSGKIGYVNFGGGLFEYRPGDDALSAVNAASPVVGTSCNIEGCATDSAGNLFASDMRGSVFLRKAGKSEFVKLYDGFHFASKDVQLVSETAAANGARDDVLALPTYGGGLMRLQVHLPGYFTYEGSNGAWAKGTDDTLGFTFKRSENDEQTFQHFTGIQVDGADVDASRYDAVAGSVVITLHADYLDTLAAGNHELRPLFDDGDGPTVTFTVQAKQADTASSTGGSSGATSTPNGSGNTSSTSGGTPNGSVSTPSDSEGASNSGDSGSTPNTTDSTPGDSDGTTGNDDKAQSGNDKKEPGTEAKTDTQTTRQSPSGNNEIAYSTEAKADSQNAGSASSAADRSRTTAVTTPKTGDPLRPAMLVALALSCTAALVVLLFARKAFPARRKRPRDK